jgi:hypothetical protein
MFCAFLERELEMGSETETENKYTAILFYSYKMAAIRETMQTM